MRMFAFTILIALAVGCASFEHNAYVGIGAATTGVELARQAYIEHANVCSCVTSAEYATVKARYEVYQAAAKVAQDAILDYKNSGDENALLQALNGASAASADIIALIESLLPPPDVAKLKPKLPKEVKSK